MEEDEAVDEAVKEEEEEDPPSISVKCLIQQNEVTLAGKTKTARLSTTSHCFSGLLLLSLQTRACIIRTG